MATTAAMAGKSPDITAFSRDQLAIQNVFSALVGRVCTHHGLTHQLSNALGQPADNQDWWRLNIRCGDGTVSLLVSAEVLADQVRHVHQLAADFPVPSPLIAASIEAGLAPLMTGIEAAIGTGIQLEDCAAAEPNMIADVMAWHHIIQPSHQSPGAGLIGFLDGQNLPSRVGMDGIGFDHLPLVFRLEIGELTLNTQQLKSLAISDLLLLSEPANDSGQDASLPVRLRSTTDVTIIAALQGQTLTFQGFQRFSPEVPVTADTTDQETGNPDDTTADDTPTTESDAGVDANTEARTAELKEPEPVTLQDINALPIQLSVSLGQVELTLNELQSLQPGQTIDLGREPGHGVSLITAGGQSVGQGELVDVDGRLAIRLTNLWKSDGQSS